MANSTQRNVSDGSMTYLDISIKYQRRADISVFFNDVPAEAGTWSWVGTTDKRIAFTSVVPAGVEVLIKRTSQIDAIINIFAKGAKFNNSTMDTNFEQLLFLNQEAVEGAALTDIFNDVDFHRYRLTNLGDATGPRDAVNLQQLTSLTADSVAAAAASASASAGSASASAASASSSAVQALLAKDWATKLGSTVDGVDYSAKYWAQQAATIVGTSEAVLRDSVTGGAYISEGTTAQRPVAGPLGSHPIRYNTELQQFEGLAEGAWSSLGNVGGIATADSFVVGTTGQQYTITRGATSLDIRRGNSTGPLIARSANAGGGLVGVGAGFAANMSVDTGVYVDGDTLRYQTVEYDAEGEYSPATGKFTAKAAGIYLFNASAYFTAYSTGTQFNLQFTVNDVGKRSGPAQVNTGQFVVALTAMLRLNAGDTVKVVTGLTGSTSVLGQPRTTFFTGVLVKAI